MPRPARDKGSRRSKQPIVICRCEEVTAEQIEEVIRQGYHNLEEIKRILRCGMGHCQGRGCQTIIAGIITRLTGKRIEAMAFPRPRPPLVPLPLSLLSGQSKRPGEGP
ncbi:MAG: (2Fe-2S)-binding protein [candidate division WOR-3 bacterium]